MRNLRLYGIWAGMKQRCYNPKATSYRYYGAKGIRVCREWFDYKTFQAWALSHGYAEGLVIDRIEAKDNYEPSNCRWVTRRVNNRHVKPYLDEFEEEDPSPRVDLRMTAIEIANLRKGLDLSQSQLAKRLSVALRTVQNWEQGLRRPSGPAVLLLQELAERPRRRR